MSNSVDLSVSPMRAKGRPKRVNDLDRRAEILQAAYEAFLELGFAKTTTGIVAAKAKISKRSIYELFVGKDELFAAVVRQHRHLVLDLPRPAGELAPLLDTLESMFRLDMEPEQEREREALLHLVVRESTLLPELSDYLYDEGVLQYREEIINWLEMEKARGRLSFEDAAVCAGMLMDMVFGALLPRRRIKDDEGRALRKAHIRKRLGIFLRGIGAHAEVEP